MNDPILEDGAHMLTLLECWTRRGWLRELDLALVRFLSDEVPDTDPALMLASALVSHQLGRGHVCLDLETVLDDPYMALSLPPEQDDLPDDEPLPPPGYLLEGWTIRDWIDRLLQFPRHAELVELDGTNDGRTPLVLVGHRLYLRRYWRYERQVETALRARIAASPQIAAGLPDAAFKATLDALFPPASPNTATTGKIDWQKIACALAARSAFSIVTGGPGTGKTTTVIRLLSLLQSIALAQDAARPLQIRLAAPTGKAAARLRTSIAGAIDTLPAFVRDNPALCAAIPGEVTTLHRLLGTRPDSRRFRHDARNPLPLDVLVVDEGSMVDLEMMAALLQALPPTARLILLGDKDQLASVEAGSVLGELCRRARDGHYRPDTVRWLEAVTGATIDPILQDSAGLPLDQNIVMLRESRRFAATSGIGQLADAVNAGDAAAIHAVWQRVAAGDCPDLLRHDLPTLDDARLAAVLLGEQHRHTDAAPHGIAAYLAIVADEQPSLDADKAAFDAWAARVLATHGRFQLLCALRNGPFGVSGMNARIEALLAKRGLIRPDSLWYAGRPVLVTRNDYRLNLMNGDIGIALPFPAHQRNSDKPEWSLRVAFPKNDGTNGIHWVLPSRLLSAETVFALTVHKSQGSEFEHCALLLPPERNPLLTRELVYTGITRGKRWFSMLCIGNAAIVEEAAARTVQRSGGLFAGESRGE